MVLLNSYNPYHPANKTQQQQQKNSAYISELPNCLCTYVEEHLLNWISITCSVSLSSSCKLSVLLIFLISGLSKVFNN